MKPSPPLVLCLSGQDPTGGAGLHADIEAVRDGGGHALGIVTALTVQDTLNVRQVQPTDPAMIEQQIACLANDCRIAAIKIGLLGSAAQIPVIARWLQLLRAPVVMDPVLRAGGGTDLASEALIDAIHVQLLPWVTLLTPNAAEARRLARMDRVEDAGTRLAQQCRHVLVTGGDEPGPVVTNRWYRQEKPVKAYEWPRLPETFHGAGCTLAAACAVLLARELSISEAIEQGQRYTQHSLQNALAIGHGRRIPGRHT